MNINKFSEVLANKYEDINLVPPKGAQDAAKKVLRWKEEYPDEVKAMTPVGWARARQLAKGNKLSPDIVRRMSNFARHRKNSEIKEELKATPWKDNGYVAWLGWGGDIGIDWAKRKVDEMNRIDEKRMAKELIKIARKIIQEIK